MWLRRDDYPFLLSQTAFESLIDELNEALGIALQAFFIND
jgi:hypothetical protein